MPRTRSECRKAKIPSEQWNSERAKNGGQWQPVSIFLNTFIRPLLENRFSCQNVKCRNVQRCGVGVFHLLAFFKGSVKVNCHNWPIIEHTRRGIPEWGIGINAYRLHYFFSLQLTRCVRATFLDLLSILDYYRALDSETSTTTFSIISSARAWENVILAGKPHSGCHSTMSFSENVVVAETSCEIGHLH